MIFVTNIQITLGNSVRIYAGFLYNKFSLFRTGQRQ